MMSFSRELALFIGKIQLGHPQYSVSPRLTYQMYRTELSNTAQQSDICTYSIKLVKSAAPRDSCSEPQCRHCIRCDVSLDRGCFLRAQSLPTAV
eukprot:191329-Pleurochrysis_carterae.AAC.1